MDAALLQVLSLSETFAPGIRTMCCSSLSSGGQHQPAAAVYLNLRLGTRTRASCSSILIQLRVLLQQNIHLYTFPDRNLSKIESGARRLLYCRHLLVIRARVGNNNDGGLVYKYFWRSVGIFFSDKNLGRLAAV